MTVQGVVAGDFTALNDLKALASKDAQGALPEVAKQFESIFIQSMLKSMRMGEHFLDESSPFRGKDRETFQEMLDAQYASTIASGQGVGLASMLAQQLNPLANNQGAERPVMPAFELHELKQPETAAEPNKSSVSVDDFVRSIWPKAKQAASVLGLDPKILMAQAALETGWGKFVTKDADGSSTNNLFNIKGDQNSEFGAVRVKTTEYIADTPIKMNASFKKYPSVEHSLNDYIALIQGDGRYQSALANAQNPEEYVNELAKAGYATDPQYSTKILSIYHGSELNQAIEKCDLSEHV